MFGFKIKIDNIFLEKAHLSFLRGIQEYGTLTDAAESLEMSYRHAWGIIKKIERLIGEPLIKTRKGGKAGGGGTELTEVGIKILERYSQIKRIFLKRP
ncbi:TPA: LysR family transcriptional regulator [Candidatus Bathyarchaeota archaeon]|nr:LysR family transcriptional regulator [Candidatus Bathyarchaeota archaeon]